MDSPARPDMKFQSLLTPEEAAGAPAPAKPAPARHGLVHRLRNDQRLGRILGGALALAGVVAGASVAWSELRPINPPDVFADPFKDVLGFALLDKDFNRLPIEERIRLLQEMAEKIRGLSSGDSAMMAAFAAGITGKAREQLEANLRTLMVDLVDKFALEYAQSTEADREKAMEQCLLEMFELTNTLRMDEAKPTDDTPAENLAEVRESASARAERMKGEGKSQVDSGDVAGVFQWVQSDVSKYSEPNERARTTRFMRDAVRYMRGQDINTGKPKKKG
jgi:hypothetical protein